MKEIMSIIRMSMVNKTKAALAAEGFPAFTCAKVSGRGKKQMHYQIIEEGFLAGENISTAVAESISEEHRLLPKRWISITVPEEDVAKVVDVIINVNQTGHPGDGKIFVLPMEEAIRIRTGEAGDSAIV
ncbi:nitrogen regulatory protein PII [Clostridium aceticum]|uniref:Nitrogen regulatory protein PII n=1 Tax=Clostridium aceticum TaxID=84022 RepID=A0A0D8ICS9_9CLOT|nr:P-II family nitrogen regulator [Clostridium aceticum]AKL94864.1 nitrogen regulatory protein PII [Clostridium aceticum]KJF27792.1 nitrogen fixation protein [Clostridium aceticum]